MEKPLILQKGPQIPGESKDMCLWESLLSLPHSTFLAPLVHCPHPSSPQAQILPCEALFVKFLLPLRRPHTVLL